jgi:hypothetical protein
MGPGRFGHAWTMLANSGSEGENGKGWGKNLLSVGVFAGFPAFFESPQRILSP